jgi:hypothetical protein
VKPTLIAADSTPRSDSLEGSERLRNAQRRAEQLSDAQRSDVPYRWPRGPEAPDPIERTLRRKWVAAAIVAALLSLALLWMMIASRW